MGFTKNRGHDTGDKSNQYPGRDHVNARRERHRGDEFLDQLPARLDHSEAVGSL